MIPSVLSLSEDRIDNEVVISIAAQGVGSGRIGRPPDRRPARDRPGHGRARRRHPAPGRGAKVVDTGHEPKHPLKIKAKRDAQRQAALEAKLTGKKVRPRARARRCRSSSRAPTGSSSCSPSSATCATRRRPTSGSPTPRRSRCRTRSRSATTVPCTTRSRSPTATVDNTTLWQPDFDRAHFEDMYFNRMAEYYEEQSSGRYSVDGDVTEWVKVPYNQALYGRGYCGTPPGAPVTTCASTKALVRDALAHLGQEPARQRPDDDADPRLPEDVRQPGPLRRRPRRQLRRARRLHRPLPDRPRGRRRGGRRPDLRVRRDLEPPLVQQPPGRRPRWPDRREHRLQRRRVRTGRQPDQPGPEQPDRRMGG